MIRGQGSPYQARRLGVTLKRFFAARQANGQQAPDRPRGRQADGAPSATIKRPPSSPAAGDDLAGRPLYIRDEWTQSQPPAPRPPRSANDLLSGSFPGAEPAAHCERQQRANLAAQHGRALARIVEQRMKDPKSPLRRSLEAFYRGRWSDVEEEISLVLDALNSIDKMAHCFGSKFERILVIMPRNLPLYSFLVFCVVPASQAQEVLVHYPQLVQDRVLPILGSFAECIRGIPDPQRGARELQKLSRRLTTGGAIDLDLAAAAAQPIKGPALQYTENSCKTTQSPDYSFAPTLPPTISLPGFGLITVDTRNTSLELIKTNSHHTDAIVFTGSFKNAQTCIKSIQDKNIPVPIFFYNGSGYNPAVVGPMPPAELPEVVQRLVCARLLNGGQDCGAPDAIIVHASHLDQFLVQLNMCLDRESKYFLLEMTRTYNAAKSFISRGQASGRILRGHCGNRKIRQVYPIISLRSIKDFAQASASHAPASELFEEYYAPIFNIITYQDDNQLGSYFEAAGYQDKSMYVSLFGSSPYINRKIPADVLLDNVTVPEWDQAFKAYGGYGSQASSIILRGRKRDQPINLCRDLPYARLQGSAERERSHQPRARYDKIYGNFIQIIDAVDQETGGGSVASAFYYGQVTENEEFINPYAQVKCLVVAHAGFESAVAHSLSRVTAAYLRDAPPDEIWAQLPQQGCANADASAPWGTACLPEADPAAWHRANTMSFGPEPLDGLAAALARAGQLQIRQAPALPEVVRLIRYNALCFQERELLPLLPSAEDRAIVAALTGSLQRIYWRNQQGCLSG